MAGWWWRLAALRVGCYLAKVNSDAHSRRRVWSCCGHWMDNRQWTGGAERLAKCKKQFDTRWHTLHTRAGRQVMEKERARVRRRWLANLLFRVCLVELPNESSCVRCEMKLLVTLWFECEKRKGPWRRLGQTPPGMRRVSKVPTLTCNWFKCAAGDEVNWLASLWSSCCVCCQLWTRWQLTLWTLVDDLCACGWMCVDVDVDVCVVNNILGGRILLGASWKLKFTLAGTWKRSKCTLGCGCEWKVYCVPLNIGTDGKVLQFYTLL